MSHSAIVVFTARSRERIVREGGSASWVLNARRASNCEYLVCTQNQHNSWGDASAEHGSAFLIGRISRIEPMPEWNGQSRWLIAIDEYAEVSMAKVWGGWRNPVRYATLEDLDIDVHSLEFQAMPPRSVDAAAEDTPNENVIDEFSADGEPPPLTISEAKAGLAVMFSVDPDDIQIIIKG